MRQKEHAFFYTVTPLKWQHGQQSETQSRGSSAMNAKHERSLLASGVDAVCLLGTTQIRDSTSVSLEWKSSKASNPSFQEPISSSRFRSLRR